jgi:hypothetical protein
MTDILIGLCIGLPLGHLITHVGTRAKLERASKLLTDASTGIDTVSALLGEGREALARVGTRNIALGIALSTIRGLECSHCRSAKIAGEALKATGVPAEEV